MEKDLSCPLVATVDQSAMCRVGDAGIHTEELLERCQIAAERSPRSSSHMITGEMRGNTWSPGEKDPSPRVSQAYMGRLVPGRMNHLERASVADIDSLTIGHRVIGRIDERHVLGAGGQVAGNRAQHTRRDTMSAADAKEAIDVPRRIVVPIDQFGGPLVHHNRQPNSLTSGADIPT